VSRIVAGSRGGHRLATPAGSVTRPTTDRVREALFSALAAWAGGASASAAESLAGVSFLDLYAGSGAVGLEAASRGAAPVVLVEADRRVARTVARNVADVGLPAELRTGRVETVVGQPCPVPGGFVIVFADPPYELDSPTLDAAVTDLVGHGWLAPDGLLVLERSVRSAPPTWPPGFESWERRYGETVLHFAGR
jgi:16S rRNA (guanine966-N2)-methyltransferase